MSSIPGSPEAVCVEISYDLSSDQAHRLRHCFEDLAAQGRDVVIDCSKVERMDSSGVGALVFLFKRIFKMVPFSPSINRETSSSDKVCVDMPSIKVIISPF